MPREGAWRATGTTTAETGYLPSGAGEKYNRRWDIARRCTAGVCSYFMTRQLATGAPLTARLALRKDGWHATYPEQTRSCNVINGQRVTWQQESRFIYRFSDHGRTAQAHQVDLSYAPRCGYGTSRVTWQATLASDQRDPLGNTGPVGRTRGPLNNISERALAHSVQHVVDTRITDIDRLVETVIGRHIDLRVAHGHTTCRSRDHTPTRTGAPFTCSVGATATGEPGRFGLGIILTDIEGRCWTAVNDRVIQENPPPLLYSKAVVEYAREHQPLQGCA